MKKLLSKILPCLLVVLLVIGLVGCNDKKYKHPKNEPNISNATEVFLELGSKKITNQTVYNRLLQTYGLDTLIAWMDEITLKDHPVVEADYKEQMDYIIYGTTDTSDLDEEEMKKAYDAFVKNMYNQGYTTEAAWKAYYELEYKRYAYGLEKFEEYVNELNASEDEKKHYFTEEDYQIAYETLYQSDYTVIILTFDSEYEAKQILEQQNVDINNLTFGWAKKDGTKLTAEEIKKVFTDIHGQMNPGIAAEQTYKFLEKSYRNELANYSSTIASKVSNLETITENYEKSYTRAPLSFGNRFYLALKVSETEIETEYSNATAEQKAEVFKYMLESTINSAFLLVSAQQKGTLKIFDEGLEIGYKSYYNTNITESKLEVAEYQTTTDESSTVVAELTYNGVKHELTADQLFERLVAKYGTALSLLYMQEYVVLSNPEYNKVTEYNTNKVLDQETYDKYYKTDVTAYKDALTKGDYASKGFPANYGWEQFRVDYLGASSDEELMNSYGGSLYSAAEGYFIKDIYMDEEIKETDSEGTEVVIQTADHLVQKEMERIFNEFFSATMIGVYAYYDKEANGLSDGKADEMTEEQAAKAKALVDLVYEEAKKIKADEINGTLAASLEKVVKEYKSTTYLKVNKWTEYKKAGLQLVLVSSTTYTNTSTANENILAEAKKQWEAVRDFKNSEEGNPKKVDAIGQTLDPGYRNVTNSVVTYVTAETFGDKSEAFIANDAAYRLIITKATDHTYIKKSTALYKPTLAEYESYSKDTSNVSSAVATAIKTYYTVAISNLTTTEIVSDLLFTNCKELINANTVKFVAKPELKDVALKVIENSLSNEE